MLKNLLLFLTLIIAQCISAQLDEQAILKDNTQNTEIDISNNKVSLIELQGDKVTLNYTNGVNGISNISINGEATQVKVVNGRGIVPINNHGLNLLKSESSLHLVHLNPSNNRLKRIPLWTSLIPPLLTIALALILKEVLISLFIGIWSGALLINGADLLNPLSWIKSLFNVLDTFIIGALADSGHLSVIMFSMMIGGMVALISKNGGMHGVVNKLGTFAKNRTSTQKTTWLLGILIFFDDYANTLIVGNTMRPVTDKFRISREKLAYIVDSTAAPVAAIAFITTWIGAELGYIGDATASLDLPMSDTPYALFFASLKYSFYPILTLAFVYFIISQQRDFGPMHAAESRAILTGQVSPAATEDADEPDMEDLSPVKGSRQVWWHAALPIAFVIGVTILGLLITGFDGARDTYEVSGSWGAIWPSIEGGNFFSKLGTLIGMSDSYVALIWASFAGLAVALMITIWSRTMSIIDSVHWLMTGFKTMMPAILVLVLAWSLAGVTEALYTSEYLSNFFSDRVSPYLLPGLIFVLAASIAFATGSSWSTMAILYPVAIPTAVAVCASSGLSPELSHEIMLCVIATVLAASVLGDHCSPISDTTILSSLATDCNHLDHVKTQLPYALTVGGVSILGITISILLGGGWIIALLCMLACGIGLYFLLKVLGKAIPQVAETV